MTMNKKDFYDLENQIRDTIKNALDVIDFAKMKKEIDSKTESTLNEVKTNLKNKSQHYNKKIKNKMKDKYSGFSNTTKIDENKVQSYIAKRPVGSISGILYTILGSISSGILGILLITYSIFISFWSGFSITSGVSLALIFSFFSGSIALTLKGIILRKRVKRFKYYVSLLNNNFCHIEELAIAIKKKNKFVVRDLRKMIDLGMFPQGHIDDKQTYFMLSNEIYENYLNSQQALKKRNEDELRRKEELNKEVNDPLKKELRQTIEMGKIYIQQIKDINDSINREKIATKLFRLQNVVSQIFKYLEQNPKKLQEVSKFTNHYLPMTLKLVNVYKDLNDQPVQGDNIRNAKNEIEKTMDTINIAFEKLLDDLFEEIALDISTDISVLETLFTQEGLTKNDFKK
jgi:5-bromo-4-chloroindolyl phosphate hydrolysis protein